MNRLTKKNKSYPLKIIPLKFKTKYFFSLFYQVPVVNEINLCNGSRKVMDIDIFCRNEITKKHKSIDCGCLGRKLKTNALKFIAGKNGEKRIASPGEFLAKIDKHITFCGEEYRNFFDVGQKNEQLQV